MIFHKLENLNLGPFVNYRDENTPSEIISLHYVEYKNTVLSLISVIYEIAGLFYS